MNESHFTYKVNGVTKSEWASEWSDIKAKHPTATLLHQSS
jgi:hypothetical protein